MEVYIGDIYKKDVIKNIYNDFKDKYEKGNYSIMELTESQLKELVKKDYINMVNGIKLDLHFFDDWVEFNETRSNVFLDAIFRIKLLDGIISYNDPALSMLKVNEEKIKERRNKIFENESAIKKLGVSNLDYKSMGTSTIIKNNVYDNNKYKAYLLWKENNLLMNEISDIKKDSNIIKYDIVNRGLSRNK